MLVIGGAIAAAVSLGSRAQTKKAREAWTVAADRLGFAMVEGGYKGLAMAGDSGDLPVVVDVYQRGSGDSPKTLTRYRVELPPLGVDLDVRKKTGWHGVLELFGAQDLAIGNDEFDTWFRLTSSYEDRARRYLNPQRVAALLDLSGRYPSVALADGELLLETNGVTSDPDRIVATANALVDAGRVLLVTEHEAQYVLLGESAPPEDEPPRSDETMQRIHDTIEEYFEAAAEEAAPSPVAAPQPEQAPSVAASVDETAAQVAADLFGGRQLGFESERRFQERYRDTPVTWSGVVQRQAGLSASRVFEGEGHTLVEVNVAALQDDLYGTSSVDAVVAFPAGTPQPERGTTIRFSGTLVAIDPLTKDLYVAGGRIE